MTTPSQPNCDNGRPSTSITTSIMRSRSRLLDRRLVQCPVRHTTSPSTDDLDVEREPLFDLVVALGDATHRSGEVGRLGLGEKADVSEIDAEQRNRLLRARPRRRAAGCRHRRGRSRLRHRGAVGRIRQQRPRRRSRVRRPRSQGRGRRSRPRRGSARHRGRRSLPRRGRCGTPAERFGSRVTVLPRWREPGRCRPAAALRPAAKGNTPRCPPGPGSGLATTPRTPKPSTAAARATLATASARTCGSRTTPPEPTFSRPASNWGFTISTRSASGRGDRDEGRKENRERDERQVGDDKLDRRTDELGREVAHIGAVDDVDPLVGLQRPRELPVADVDRDDRLRAGPQQDVGETAGRRAGVEATPTGDLEAKRPERGQRAGEFVPAARDVARLIVVRYDEQWIVGSDGRRSFRGDLSRRLSRGRDDELGGLAARPSQAAPHQLGVQPRPADHSARSRYSSGAVEVGKRILELAMHGLVDRDVLAGRQLVELGEFRYRLIDARHARGVRQRPRARLVDGTVDIRAGLKHGPRSVSARSRGRRRRHRPAPRSRRRFPRRRNRRTCRQSRDHVTGRRVAA